MGWRNKWPEKEPRPEVMRLSSEHKERIIKSLEKGISKSPVLSALSIRVRALRGRFYFERLWSAEDEKFEVIGRITPLTTERNNLLLEVEKSHGSWYKITEGGTRKVVNEIANDMDGTFHGLGALNKSLCDREKGIDRLEVTKDDNLQFFYKKTGVMCSVQESLYHFFGLPIDVIAEPRQWYQYHRTPEIVEVSEDLSRILVTFSSMNMMSGSQFHGTCLYAKNDDSWNAYTVRPNMSHDIAAAVSWLEKKKWVS